MPPEELEIAIDRDGKVTVRTRGIKGARCLDYVALFRQWIGREESLELTSEYYEAPEDGRVADRLHQRVRRG